MYEVSPAGGEFMIHDKMGMVVAIRQRNDDAHTVAKLLNAQALNATLIEALKTLQNQIDIFYTATTTNALGRDQNRAAKKAALETVRNALLNAGIGQ